MLIFFIAQQVFLGIQLLCLVILLLQWRYEWNWLYPYESTLTIFVIGLCIPNIICYILYEATKVHTYTVVVGG